MSQPTFHATTILSVRKGEEVAIGGDGQVTMGQTVFKSTGHKIRTLYDGKVLVGFAGAVADAFSLLERFEGMLKKENGNTLKAAISLAKEWRTDKVLRRLESLMCVVDEDLSLLISGGGEVIQPDDGIIGIGSGGMYALAAARALVENTDLSAKEVVLKAMSIAADICVYTNQNIYVEEIIAE